MTSSATLVNSDLAEAPRRSFLHTARNVGVLSIALSWLARGSTAEARIIEAPEPTAQPNSGYRETDHIRKYYAAARYF